MSELSLNVAPSPELLKTAAGASPPAAPGKVPAGTGEAAGAPNPFAALLSGVLQGAQPLPETTVTGTGVPTYAELTEAQLQTDASAAGTGVLALPGTATALPASIDELPGGTSGTPAGNLLPATGKELPPEPAGTRAATATAPGLRAQDPASDAARPPPAASRPRIFLADLALSRPLEPATALPAESPGEAGRVSVGATLAGRALTAGTSADGDTAGRSGDLTRGLAPIGYSATPMQPASLAGNALAGGDGPALRATSAELPTRGAGVPGAGTDFLAGQLAAFAASNDTSTSPGSPALTATGSTDAGSAALLGRLGSTGMPALQPLGDSGAFASGLADRLLTLGGPGAHSARLKLHPEHLGELDVEITMDDGTAQVWFGTTTSQARDAIEGSLPKLREMFAEQGIELTRTQIDAGSGQPGQSAFGQERRMAGGAGAWNDIPSWQPARPAASAGPADGTAEPASTRLLDVWA